MDQFNFEDKTQIKNLNKQVKILFEVWSTLPRGKKHRVDESSKLYQTVFRYVHNLRSGLPLCSVSGGSAANLNYLRSLRMMVNTVSNNDKRILNLLHRKWRTKEIKDILVKIGNSEGPQLSLDKVFWMPVVRFPLENGKYSKTGFSYFSLYALNENTGNQYNDFVNEFYRAPFAREVSDLTKQKEAILIEGYVTSKKASMTELKNLFSWYYLAREEQFVRKVDTVTQFVKERIRLEENRANLAKSRNSTNKNSYVSQKLREKLKNIEEFQL